MMSWYSRVSDCRDTWLHLLPVGGISILRFSHSLGPEDDRCTDCKHGRRSAWSNIGGGGGVPAPTYDILLSFIS